MYPATLTVRVGPTRRPNIETCHMRPNLPTQRETARIDRHTLLDALRQGLDASDVVGNTTTKTSSNDAQGVHVLKRLRHRMDKCRLPVNLLTRMAVGKEGSTCSRYSNSGRYLAVGE